MSGYVHRSTLPQSRIRSTAPSEREPGGGAYHSFEHPETARFRAIFIAPTKAQKSLSFTIQRTTLPQLRICSAAPSEREPGGAAPSNRPPGNRNIAGDFHRPYESSKLSYAIVIPQIPGVGICGISAFTTCLIYTGGCVRLERCLPFGPAGGLRYCRRLQWQIADCPLRRISPNQSLQVLRC